MKKYLTVFSTSWSNGLVYPLNFFLWRLRSVLVILTIYFMWDALFISGNVIAGYTRAKMITYIFLTLVLRSVVMGNRSIDLAGEISDGRLTNYILKPLNFHLYWLTRDLADKLLNVIFIIFEAIALCLILRPNIFLPTDPFLILAFFVSVIGGIFLCFLMGMFASSFAFWTPGNAWGFWFLYFVFQDFLGGTIYPLDVFSGWFYQVLRLLPFGYLMYFPAGIFLEKFSWLDIYGGFAILGFWIIFFYYIVKKEWKMGVKDYRAEGR